MRDDARQMIILRRLGPHEFSAGRRVEKQIADRDRRAGIAGGVLNIDQPAALDQTRVSPTVSPSVFVDQLDFRDRRDRRQRFAAETECADRAEIFERP